MDVKGSKFFKNDRPFCFRSGCAVLCFLQVAAPATAKSTRRSLPVRASGQSSQPMASAAVVEGEQNEGHQPNSGFMKNPANHL